MKCPLTGLIAGIDEAGRGPLAGPVVSSCVVWKGIPDKNPGVHDSKLLTAKEREHIISWIVQNACRVGVGIATNDEIDSINILQASILSMDRAFIDTGIIPDVLLIDGRYGINSFPNGKAIVRGDRKCFYIACASIVAKVVRDTIMVMYDHLYPHYNFKRNKGYPTKDHKEAIRIYGITPIHRKTFRGIREHCEH